jgi:L-alanine-DL-glutamate epimerase-like enolase superfamily enzyme
LLKITKTEHWTENLVLIRPYRIANRTFTDIENHFVRIRAANGLYGVGSASPGGRVTGETMQDCANALDRHMDDCLAGRNLNGFSALSRRLHDVMASTPAALAAVDMALHDLAGKRFGLPVVDLLGRYHRSMPTSITIGIQSVDGTLADADEFLGKGFRILKVKIGNDLALDVERLHRLRETVGSGIGIRVDANQGYSVDELRTFCHKTRKLELELIEQPLQASQSDAMRRLPAPIRMLAAGDESICNPSDALVWGHPPPPQRKYKKKQMKFGGRTPAMHMAQTARLAGIRLMWGCNDESCVSISAALHAAFASPATRYLDLDGSFDLGRDLFKGGFALEDGELRLTDAPGLGVVPTG